MCISQVSGERLQDHWSSGLMRWLIFPISMTGLVFDFDRSGSQLTFNTKIVSYLIYVQTLYVFSLGFIFVTFFQLLFSLTIFLSLFPFTKLKTGNTYLTLHLDISQPLDSDFKMLDMLTVSIGISRHPSQQNS